jgi:hypothetical protein
MNLVVILMKEMANVALNVTLMTTALLRNVVVLVINVVTYIVTQNLES